MKTCVGVDVSRTRVVVGGEQQRVAGCGCGMAMSVNRGVGNNSIHCTSYDTIR